MTTCLHPDAAEPGLPYWWDARRASPKLPTLPPPRAQLLIIGAGYTGLSAAIAAHDEGASVVVVDAERPGDGASTRNGGMFGAHPRLPVKALTDRFGSETAQGATREALAAFDFTRELIETEEIDCDLETSGRLALAWTKEHHEGQKKLVADVTALGGGRMELLSRADLAEEIKTNRYAGGIRYPCLLYTSPSPRDRTRSRMPSSA